MISVSLFFNSKHILTISFIVFYGGYIPLMTRIIIPIILSVNNFKEYRYD